MAIQRVNLIINTKQLTSTAQKAHIKLLQVQNMPTHYSRIHDKHLLIPANQRSIRFENIVTGAIPDLVIVGLVSDATTQGLLENKFNFQNFGVNRIDL